jgi:hypothetical protein
VLGNTRGMLSLAAAACAAAGLTVVAAVDLAPDADGERLRRAAGEVTSEQACDALLVALAPIAPHSPLDGLDHGAVPDRVALLTVLVDQAETVTLRSGGARHPIPCYNDASVAAAALAAAVSAARPHAESAQRPADPIGMSPGAATHVIADILANAPRGRSLYSSERSALLDAFGIRSAAAAMPADRLAAKLTVTAWQDVVFGPLLTCARSGDSAPASVVLAPASMTDLRDVAERVLGGATAGVEALTDLLARAAALVDGCPQVAAGRLTAWIDDGGAIRVEADDVTVTPGGRTDPYLRRLRRAPVE